MIVYGEIQYSSEITRLDSSDFFSCWIVPKTPISKFIGITLHLWWILFLAIDCLP